MPASAVREAAPWRPLYRRHFAHFLELRQVVGDVPATDAGSTEPIMVAPVDDVYGDDC